MNLKNKASLGAQPVILSRVRRGVCCGYEDFAPASFPHSHLFSIDNCIALLSLDVIVAIFQHFAQEFNRQRQLSVLLSLLGHRRLEPSYIR